ncbi:nucleotide release factor, partial [Raphidocelis subcapitata]
MLSAGFQRRLAGPARPARRNATVLAHRASLSAPSQRARRCLLSRVAAAEEEAATATESASDVDSVLLSPLDRARAALEAEELDRPALEGALADLEAEMTSLRDGLAAAESEAARAPALEASLVTSKDQYVRLQADFENFRRRMAKEKDELSSRAKGDVVTGLLPLVDAFELARTQVKAETEGEQKINNSYQGLYKQMVEILRGLSVEPVATVRR